MKKDIYDKIQKELEKGDMVVLFAEGLNNLKGLERVRILHGNKSRYTKLYMSFFRISCFQASTIEGTIKGMRAYDRGYIKITQYEVIK